MSKKAKFKLNWTIIRPVITYARETQMLKESMQLKLLVTKRKILRRIFGPTRDTDDTHTKKKISLIGKKYIIN